MLKHDTCGERLSRKMSACSKPFVLVSILTLLGLPVFAQRDRITAPIDVRQRTALAGNVHPAAISQNDRGAVGGAFQLNSMMLMLKPSSDQKAGLQQLLAAQRNPSSKSFRQWLTPDQYADQFGASSGDIAKLRDWLESQGFTVSYVARSRTWIAFNGTAAQVQSALNTQIHRYSVNGVLHYANASEPSVPAAFSSILAGIRGLNDFHPKPRSRRIAAPHMTLGNGDHQIAPDDFATIYDVAPLYQAGVDGTGQNLVVVGQTEIYLSDISAFRARFNLPAPNVRLQAVPFQPNPGISTGDLGEADLDIEWSGAVARNATIIYVYSSDVFNSAFYAVDQNLAPVLSMSYGLCEQADLIDLPTEQQVAQQANSQGMTWFAAAGDNGAGDCEDVGVSLAQDGLAVDAPASIPEITAMGGSQFTSQSSVYWSPTDNANGASALSYIPEQVWNENYAGYGIAAGGGGASVFFPRPDWQTGPGVPNDSARHTPDLSLSASFVSDGYYVYSDGSSGYYGGTSVAAPTMAGIAALLNQYLVAAGVHTQAGLGNINPTLYRLAQSNPAVFHDITLGDNKVPCVTGSPDCASGSFGFSAGTGYDQASGLGSVDALNLVHAWSSAPATVSAVVPSIDNDPVFQQTADSIGNQWRFTLSLTEESGIATTLTGFTVNGTSYSAAQIASFFGTKSIPANGSISASLGFKSLASVPETVVFGFSGIDASGQTWSTQLSVPFDGPQSSLSIAGISNAASGTQVFAPGQIVSLYGTGLASGIQLAGALPLTVYFQGFEALVNGVPAPLYYVSANQVNLQIPYETTPGRAELDIFNPYSSTSSTFQVAAAAPGIFTFSDGTLNPSKTAARGQTIAMFITGDGQVSPSIPDGTSPLSGTPLALLPKPIQNVYVTVGNAQATIAFIGIPPGLVGVTQINFVVPTTIAPGTQQVVVNVGGISSSPAKLTVQ